MRASAAGVVLIALSCVAARAQAPPAPAGRYIASTCTSCHSNAAALGAPAALAGRDQRELKQQLRDFRDGKRSSTVMGQLARGYSDEQIDAIAEYFSRLLQARTEQR